MLLCYTAIPYHDEIHDIRLINRLQEDIEGRSDNVCIVSVLLHSSLL